ncbi:hypothetical protein OUZ56_012979 [Daphnia magna]|uniref:Uncharacterized protein n=1 Tax=Daphnia magna TaxID=35525 RepID=A0ABQ9Z4L5_9CRUS|nr:hypothetical protein OUZ56_012979 [Daphnia magna]
MSAVNLEHSLTWAKRMEKITRVELARYNSCCVYTNECDTSESQESDVDGQLGDEDYEDNFDNLLSAKASELCKDFTMVDIAHIAQEQDTSCRRCGKENETGFHVLNHCEEGLQLATKRHNTIQDLLESLLVKQGHDVTINIAFPGQRLRPDVEFQLSGSRVMVDVVFCYDQPGSMDNAYQRKYDKYSSHGRILPLVVGSLDHGTPGTTKSVLFLESTEDPGVPSDSRPDWQRSRDQWICQEFVLTPKLKPVLPCANPSTLW